MAFAEGAMPKTFTAPPALAAAASANFIFSTWKIQKKYAEIKKTTRNPHLGQISTFGFVHDFYKNWVDGLDSDRFCAPEHIIEK